MLRLIAVLLAAVSFAAAQPKWSGNRLLDAVPFPSSIGLYKPGQGYPKDFDQRKAEEYFRRVNAKVAGLVKDTVRKWQLAGLQ
ncbi:MAG: hypothetical protein HY238_06300 [Acidobacteria bacterium]|nr:hypothetical protein [Acidobacteriota bacterium]